MNLDAAICRFDRALKTLAGGREAKRGNPAGELADAPLNKAEQNHAAGLMRVNHTGEICAQALYEGQSLAARDPALRARLLKAAEEEADHLAWCAQRLKELDSHSSLLNPLFFGASYALGALTGLAGDRFSLGFVEATEDQVCEHLQRHLDALPEADQRSRAILAQMREEEARHGAQASQMGGASFPEPVRQAMTLLSRLMTETSYRI